MPVQLQHYASSLASHRVLLYGVLSIGAVLAVFANALKKHSNFYSVAVYLSKSNGTVVVLVNFGMLLAVLFGRLLQQIFFGPLRTLEVERLYDRMWFFVTESLLAFTIFRDEFDIPFALMFGLLLFTKCFHWLLSDRIEWMDQRPYPGPPVLFHIRIHVLITLLWATDLITLLFTVESMLSHGVGGTVLFASEYAILLASLMNSVARYCIALVDLRHASLRGGENAPPWEDKSMLVFYVELATDFLKLVTYLTFFMLVLTFYGLPLNIVRDVYITARSFITRFRDLIRYRTATRNMDERYPNATEAELSSMSDKTCIICRDEMVFSTAAPAQETGGPLQAAAQQNGPNTTPKKLHCGHVFHFNCLRSWLERQQSCPTCRRSVLEASQTTHVNGQAAPLRPQPHAFPQAPNEAGAAQQQQGNRGGILGRFIGAAGAPPMVQGQFAPGPLPGQIPQPNIPVGNGVNWEGHQPQGQQGQVPAYAPPFAYPYRPQFFVPQPERFQGFWAPDGVWYPWPGAMNNLNNNNNIDAQQRGEPIPPTTSTNISTPPTTDSEGSPATSTSTSSAREAAAAAALRRLSPLNSRRASNQAPDQAPARSDTQASQSTSGDDIPASDIQAAAAASVESTAGLSSSEIPRQAPAPSLIPLFNPRESSPPLSRGFTRMQSARLSPYSGPMDRIASVGRQGPFNGAQYMRELPPSLTDEQLAVLDQLTREAIDERLRILESIQTMSARCVTDLLRCRSVLPRSSAPSTTARPQPSSSSPPSDPSVPEPPNASAGILSQNQNNPAGAVPTSHGSSSVPPTATEVRTQPNGSQPATVAESVA
ncbi:hypothetical protein EW145_g3168 [Phellinidium pouzarii]|uniref:RING-type E3 ubiquitin transferase n=1 Tax=Phellinidium pouzarii TaxID=167371 RepID=A0A4S4L8L1_9AGAM|nr:hypothetical protein EW145_g3168 [Phellinidium pouzarii]